MGFTNMGYDEQNPPPNTPGNTSDRGGPSTPWNQEEYEFPPSVGQVNSTFAFVLEIEILQIFQGTKQSIISFFFNQQNEQQQDETYEQFEERVLNKRAAHMYHTLKNKFDNKNSLQFTDMIFRNNRKQVKIVHTETFNILLEVFFQLVCAFFTQKLIFNIQILNFAKNSFILSPGSTKILHAAGIEKIRSFGN